MSSQDLHHPKIILWNPAVAAVSVARNRRPRSLFRVIGMAK